MPQFVGVSDQVDGADERPRNSEADDGDRNSVTGDDQPGGAVHGGGASEVGERPPSGEDAASDGVRASDRLAGSVSLAAGIQAENDFGVEYGHERREVAFA